MSTSSVNAGGFNQSSVSSYSQQTTKSHNTAAIVGGTLGSLALITATIALCFYLIRESRKTSDNRGVIPFAQGVDRSELNLLPPDAGIREKTPPLRSTTSLRAPSGTAVSDEVSTVPVWIDSVPPPAYSPRPHLGA